MITVKKIHTRMEGITPREFHRLANSWGIDGSSGAFIKDLRAGDKTFSILLYIKNGTVYLVANKQYEYDLSIWRELLRINYQEISKSIYDNERTK